MCDSFVALPSFTKSGNLIFGKNSDREPNETQLVLRVPRKKWSERSLQCTFIAVPQVAETFEVVLSKPYQMWGAEMGVNEYGLVIGNEAVFTKIKFGRNNDGLTGMDLLRLALERCQTADEALPTITVLLEKYGQNACGGYQNKRFYYHNSFLIADFHQAWVLETAGRHWAAQRIESFGSISNGLTIGSDFDLISKDAISFARQNRWTKRGKPFHFRDAYSDWLYTRLSNCKLRQALSNRKLAEKTGVFTRKDAMDLLRTHDRDPLQFQPQKSTSASICMHATGILNPSQTTGSMIAEIRNRKPSTIWLTGTSMPCLSIYKPLFLNGRYLVDSKLDASRPLEHHHFWWTAEKLHRTIIRNYRKGYAAIKMEKEKFQLDLLRDEEELLAQLPQTEKLDQLSAKAFSLHYQQLLQWDQKVSSLNLKERSWNALYRSFLKKSSGSI